MRHPAYNFQPLPLDSSGGEDTNIFTPSKPRPHGLSRAAKKAWKEQDDKVNNASVVHGNILQQEYQNYQREYAPFEDRVINRISGDTSLIEGAKERGAGLKDMAKGIADRNAARFGLNTVSGVRARGASRSLGLGVAKARVQGVSDARIDQHDINIRGLSALANIGQGVRRGALSSLGGASGLQAGREQAYQSAKAAHKSRVYGAIGAIAGGAAAAFAI